MNSLLSGDVQVKSMQQTVKYAEQHLGEICSLMASYTRKTAKLRDKADLLVAQVFDFSSREGTGVQIGLKNIAQDLAMVQDHRQAQVERLETQVVAPLKAYGDIVKNKRADLKKHSVDVKRELKELQKLERIQLRNPADRQSISQAEVNAQKASTNAQRSIRQLEETIEDFQRQKLEDVKRIFTDFITLEMVFHAKALEIYTHTYHNLEAINTQRDLESCSTLQCQRGMKEDEEEEEEEEEVEEKEEEKDFSRSVTEEGHLISRPSYTARRDQLRRWNSTES